MAFVYPEPHRGTFWMKNTILPLSIAFFVSDGSFLYLVRHGALRTSVVPELPDARRLPRRGRSPAGSTRRTRCRPRQHPRTARPPLRLSEPAGRLRSGRRRGRQPGVEQSGVRATGGDQLVVVAVLDQVAVLEHEHAVGTGRRRQPVRDRDRRATDRELLESVRDADLGERIDRRRGLVEQQDVGVRDPGPQQRDELPLTGRE